MSTQTGTKTAKFVLTSGGLPLSGLDIDFQHSVTPAAGGVDTWIDDGVVATDVNGVATKVYTEPVTEKFDFQAQFAGNAQYATTGWKQDLGVQFQADTTATFTVQ